MQQMINPIEYIKDIVIPSVQASSWAPDTGVTGNANDLVKKILDTILIVVVIAAVVYIMFAGLQYVTSQGDAQKAKTAMSSITNAIVGLLVAFAAYFLVSFILRQLGVDSDAIALPTEAQ